MKSGDYIKPKFVIVRPDIDGTPRYYFRRFDGSGGHDRLLPGLPWSPEFMAAYEAASEGRPILTEYEQAIEPLTSPWHRVRRFVYVIGAKKRGPVKIGISVKPMDRLATLQTGHHETLLILGFAKGGAKEEQQLHDLFEAERLRGEWFKRSPQVQNFIRMIGYDFASARQVIQQMKQSVEAT